jgi:carboxymethylenebutenolidase
MCFAFDARPPDLPTDLALPPIAGGAGAEVLELSSADGARFSAAIAHSTEGQGSGVLISPDVRGLYPFYTELAERFALAGHHAIAIDYFGRTAGLGPRGEDFDYTARARHREVGVHARSGAAPARRDAASAVVRQPPAGSRRIANKGAPHSGQ